MNFRNVKYLRPHPENHKIYGDHADADLIESVREKGILNPLLVTPDGIIINGHRRFEAAQKCGMSEVPVVEFGSDDELDILEALIESNRQRVKSNEQIGREARALMQIESEKARRRMATKSNEQIGREAREILSEERQRAILKSDKQHLEPVPEVKGNARDIVGQRLGFSGRHVEQSAAVVDAIDKLQETGRTLEAQELRTKLNQSVKKAYEDGRKTGYIAPAQPRKPAPEPEAPQPTLPDMPPPIARQDYMALTEWRTLSIDAQNDFLLADDSGKKFNKQDDAHIEWAHWSWNPITGCKHNCPYCYARDIANRFYPTKFEPTIWPERLHAPRNTFVPAEAEHDIGYKNVFTCSMADLFGRWVPSVWIETVLDVIALNPQWNFLFLTKFPIRMAEFEFPDNAWVGTSVDCQIRVKPVEDAFSRVRAKVKWLSCEPMIEPLHFTALDMFSWVVIGGASKSTQTPEWVPPRTWVSDLEAQARAAGVMVYEKTNLQPIERLREFPGQRSNYEREAPPELRYLPEVES